MALETTTYLSGLVSSNPAATDTVGQGDDHIRLIKSTLLATFPNFTAAALSSTQAELDAAVAATGSSGSLALALGSAAAPTYAFTGETTTGLYSAGAGKVDVAVAGSLLAEFAAAGLTLSSGDVILTTGNVTVTAGDVNLVAGAFKLNGTSIFPLQSAHVGASQILTAAIANSNVTYAKIQNVTDQKLLGNVSGAAAAPEEIGIGAGLAVASGSLTAPAVPVPGVSRNKVIKVLTNTTVSVKADYISVTDGTVTRLVAINSTDVNLGSNGSIDELASGLTIAEATWYYIWAAAKADGSAPGVVIGTSATAAPTLPTGYTLSAYMGPLRTAVSAAQLMGSHQRGQVFEYVYGLAQSLTTSLRAAHGNAGDYTVPTYVSVDLSAFVPPNAVSARLSLTTGSSSGVMIVAPSSSYGTFDPSDVMPPHTLNGGAGNGASSVEVFLETAQTVYWAANGAGSGLWVRGFIDAF